MSATSLGHNLPPPTLTIYNRFVLADLAGELRFGLHGPFSYVSYASQSREDGHSSDLMEHQMNSPAVPECQL